MASIERCPRRPARRRHDRESPRCRSVARASSSQGDGALAPRRAELRGGPREALAVTAEQRDLTRSLRLQLAHDRQRDLRGPSEHHHAPPGREHMTSAHRASPHSPRRRARSERRIPSGSTLARSEANSPSRGYIARTAPRLRRASFVRYTRPPQPATSSSSSSRAERTPGSGGGQVDRERPPLEREREGPAEGRAEPLEDSQVHRQPAHPHELEAALERGLLAGRDHELVLDQARRTVEPIPVAEHVEREEVGRERQRAPSLAPGARSPVERVEGAHRRRSQQRGAGMPTGRPTAAPRRSVAGYALARRATSVPCPGESSAGSGSARLITPRPIFASGGEHVQPGDGVAMALGAAQQLERLLQAVGPVDVGSHPRRGQRLSAQRRLDDHARQAHAAEGRVEELGVAAPA